MSDGRIVVAGLTKHYGKLRAVDDLTFAVEPGRVTGFLGPNGAGKTTTLRMLLDLVRPTAGTATIDGRRYSDLPKPLRVVGAVLESAAAHRGRTGRDHLRIVAAAAGLPPARVDAVLDLVGLTAGADGQAADRKFRGYSLGMRQRLGIAQAMLGDPRVLILDEPSNGLDPEGIRWMRTLLRGLAAEGRTVLVSSHLLAETQLLVDDLVIIAAGRLVRHGTVEELVSSATVRVRTPETEALAAELRAGGATVTVEPDGALTVTGADPLTVGAAAHRIGAQVHELVAARPDLEAVFLELTQGQATIR